MVNKMKRIKLQGYSKWSDVMKNNKITDIQDPILEMEIGKHEFAEMYKEIVDSTFTWKNFSPEEQAKILAADRSNNCLDTTKLQQIYPQVKHIKDAVRKTLIRMKEKKNNIQVNEQ